MTIRVLAAVPTYDDHIPALTKSLMGLKWKTLTEGDVFLGFDYQRGYDVARARNNIVDQAIREEYDYVFMVDSDIRFESWVLDRFLEDPVEVCLGYYMHRTWKEPDTETRTNLCKLDGERNFTHQYTKSEMADLRNAGTRKFKVHGGGLGCSLISVETLKKLEWPWFRWMEYVTRHNLSEDLFFCKKCWDNGIPVHADARIGVDHQIKYFAKAID